MIGAVPVLPPSLGLLLPTVFSVDDEDEEEDDEKEGAVV